MRAHLTVGRIRGIRIGLHYSWLLIVLLLAVALYSGYQKMFADWTPVAVGAWAALTTVLFFVSLLLHELAHSLLALRYGLRVREITLFALGGVSQIEGEMPNAATEFRIAIAGPMTSAAIGIFCLSMMVLSGLAAIKPVAAMLFWLGYINLALAAFNLLPGFPMDGGRVLRAFLWWRTGNLERATSTAGATGRVLAFVFIAAGIIYYFRGGGLTGLWIALLGWFLLQSSRETQMGTMVRQKLRNIRVSQVMVPALAALDGDMSLQEFVDQELLRSGRRSFLVKEDGLPEGVVAASDVQSVDATAWPWTLVHSVMRKWENSRSIEPETPLLEAMEVMMRANLDDIPVVRGGRFEGLLSQAEVLAYLERRIALDFLRANHRSVFGSEAGDSQANRFRFAEQKPELHQQPWFPWRSRR